MAAAMKPLIDSKLPSNGLSFLSQIKSIEPILFCCKYSINVRAGGFYTFWFTDFPNFFGLCKLSLL